MESLWKDAEAAQFGDDLGLRVYTSRLLGRDKSLVLHGGGNTSVKLRERNLLGDEEDILYVKGSGWDLERIEAAGFSPVRLLHLLRLAGLEALSDPEMVNQLVTHMTRASAPAPSVETILHAILPYKYVDHTHADAVLSITNTADGEARIRELYGSHGRGHPLHHAGVRSRAPVRPGVSARGRSEDHRHGADESRRVFVRRVGARVLRAHDPAGEHGRGVPGRTPGLVSSRARRCSQPLRRCATSSRHCATRYRLPQAGRW